MNEPRYCNCYDPWNCREPLVDRPCRPWTKRERENAERADALQAERTVSLVHKNCRIAQGVTRHVLLVGSVAIKVPRVSEWRLFLLGLLANMQEAIFSKTRWPELCPVLWHVPGGWLVVMRRARVLTDDEFAALDLESWVDRGDYVIPAEVKPDSFGYLDGQLVAVDYGN